MAENENYYQSVLGNIKEKLRAAHRRALLAVNNELLRVYWEIGQAILLQQQTEKWGTKVIDRLSADLRSEFPDMQGLSVRNLKYMRSFAEAWPEFGQQPAALLQAGENQNSIIVQQPAAQLPWGHHQVLLDRVKSTADRKFYIEQAAKHGWSRNILLEHIRRQLHLRLGKSINNFETTLPAAQSDLAKETLKNPYMIEFLGLTQETKERELERALTAHIKKFMQELGRGFAYVGNQFNLRVEGDEFFLDLLFFNYLLDCFVVIELKVSEFQPEFAGKLNFYINAVDHQIKLPHHKPTIGILLCKTPNASVVKFSLSGINAPIGVSEYELTNSLPEQLAAEIPSVEELENELEKETLEFEEHLSTADKRLQSIKERLKNIKTEPIRTPATFDILQQLFAESLKPLYLAIIEKLSVFNEDFQDIAQTWTCEEKSFTDIAQLEKYWQSPDALNKIKTVKFQYNMFGFRKGGAENFSAHLYLNLTLQPYWYGFAIGNIDHHDPVLKKLYHQALTVQDQVFITDILMNTTLDRIEWMLNVISERENKK